MKSRPRAWAALFLLLGLSLALYANAFGNQFVFDDQYIRNNKAIRSLDTLLEVRHQYRPVRYLSFALDYAISGDRPWAYHVLNALYHGLVAFAVLLVLRRLTGSGLAALAGALVFVSHPVHTESVAYVSGRRDLLMALFYLLGFLCWLEFGRTSRWRWLAVFLVCLGLALGAKEMAVTLPAMCVLHDLLLDRENARRRWPLYAAGLLLAAGAAAAIAVSGASHQWDWHGGSAGANFATSARLVVHYARILLFPLRLVADYSYEGFRLSRSLLEPHALGAWALIAAAVSTAAYAFRRLPRVSFGIAWFLITLLPVLHIVPFHELAAEHYLYLPSVGFCLLAALGFERLRVRGPRPTWALLGLVLLLFSARTMVRNRDWRDVETLWRATAEASPRCARAQYNLGVVHTRRREWEEAAGRMSRALEIKPDYILAHVELGKVYMRLRRHAEARARFEEALRLAYADPYPPVSAGEIGLRLGRYEEAARAFEAEIAKGRRVRESLQGMALCQEALGRSEAALAAYERALQLEPDDVRLVQRAAAAAWKAGQNARAEELGRRAKRLAAEEGRGRR